MAAKGANAVQLHRSLAVRRARRGVPAPNVTNIRKLVKGRTYNRGSVERRGRPSKLTHSNVMILNRTRKLKLKKANGEHEVTWDSLIRVARVPKYPEPLPTGE